MTAPAAPAARAARRLAVAAAALLLAACGGDPTGIESSSGERMVAVGAGRRALDPALVGRWTRVVLVDATAGLHVSETRWTFHPDGQVERRLVTTNLTLGLADQILSFGTWSTASGTVTIVFDDATGTTLRLAYAVAPRVDGVQLTLGGLLFERFAP